MEFTTPRYITGSDKRMVTPVITSKPAQQDLEKIKGIHADLLKGMSLQSQKAEMFNQQKAAELASQNSMKMEIGKSKMTADTATQKNSLDFASKQAEIDVKRSALAGK